MRNTHVPDNLHNVDELNDRHLGETIIVVGTSGSLNELDLERMSKFTMIGCNDALGRFDTMGLPVPSYLLTAEVAPVIRAMPDLKAHPETTLITRKRVAYHTRDQMFYEGDIYVYELRTKPVNWSNKGSLHQANNTAHYAVQIAARMCGVKTSGVVALAGVDLRYPIKKEVEEGKQNHYWGDGHVDGCRPAFDSAIEFFPMLRQALNGRGIKLVTLSPWDGPLTRIVPQATLEDLVK